MSLAIRASAAPYAAPFDAALGAARPAPGLVARVRRRALATPDRAAFVLASADGRVSTRVTYAALMTLADGFAAGLRADGYVAGDRLLLLAPPTAELYALALAVLAEGMTLSLVDGRATPRRLYDALAAAAPRAVVGSRAVMRWWPLVGALRRARRYTVDAPLPGTRGLATLPMAAGEPRSAPAGDGAAIASFTSGNSGAPKVVVRTHAVLDAQHLALGGALPAPPEDVNLPGFPMAVLHNLCCGTTTVLPLADLRATADAEPSRTLAVIRGCGVTSLSGAPAFLRRLARCALAEGRQMPAVRAVVVGGGPVGRGLARLVQRAFPNATAHAVYGATEAEPIATATFDELLESDGSGFLVGAPRVELVLAADGEVLVRGAHVIGEGWHRTGDVGRLDERGRLWLLGRTGIAGIAAHPYEMESAALAVDDVDQAGFVAHSGEPRGELALAIADGADRDAVVRAVIERIVAGGLRVPPIRLLAALPTDARHASKVRRAALARALARGDA